MVTLQRPIFDGQQTSCETAILAEETLVNLVKTGQVFNAAASALRPRMDDKDEQRHQRRQYSCVVSIISLSGPRLPDRRAPPPPACRRTSRAMVRMFRIFADGVLRENAFSTSGRFGVYSGTIRQRATM